MNDIIENGHNQNQPNQLDSGNGGSTSSSVTQSTDLLDQFSAPDLEHSNLNQVNINLNDLNDSTINLNNSNGSLDLGSININFPLTSADPNIKTVPSPKKSSSKKRKLDELAFENISDSESAGSNSSKESKCKDMKYGSGNGGGEYSYGNSHGDGPSGQDFLDQAASSILDTDTTNKNQEDTDTCEQTNQPNSNEQIYQHQQPLSNRQPTPSRVGSPGFNHQLQSPYMMHQQNGANGTPNAQIQSPGCVNVQQQQQQQAQQQQQQPVPSPMNHQQQQQIQSPMQAKPPTPHGGNQTAGASPAHYHRQFNDPNDPNFQGVPPHHQSQAVQQPPQSQANATGPPLPPPPQPTFIHVFTTQIANEAAQSVTRQQHRSIIDFHRQMPASIDFMRNFHQHHQAMQRAPNGVPLPVPNEHLTVEQLKTRTEKLGKLKNLSSIIGIGGAGGQMPPEPGAKRARSSNTPGQVPGSGAPSPFTNGEIYPIDQFNPMINYDQAYRMGSSPQQHQQQQLQGPPPPYALKPSKMHKAGMPEKYADKLKSGHSPAPLSDTLNTGLQTTPSPQLMNYFELEGQELTITKQLNLSFKTSSNNLDNGPIDDKNLARPPSAQNSNIINCLNGSNANQSPNGNDDTDNSNKIKSDSNEQYQIDQNEQSSTSSSRKTPGINKSLSNSQLDYYQNVNSPHSNNNSQSPAMNGASGPLNQMLQMTNSIPKASPYSNAKSPGINHPQFSASHPQMSSSPSPIIQPPGIPPHILMQQQQQQQQQQQHQHAQAGMPGPMPPMKNGKMSKKQQQQHQQHQQEMMQRGMMMEGMPPPPHGMHRPPPPHMIPPHMMNHPGMGDPRLMGPRFPPQNAPNFRPMRDSDMFQNGGGGPPPQPPGEFPPGDYPKPPQQHRSSKSRQNEMIMMNGPPPPNMMQMINNGKYPIEQQMYAPGPGHPPGHHNEFANGPPRPMHPMHMGPRPPMDPGMIPPGMMPNGMSMMRPMHPNQGPPPPPFDMHHPPPHHHPHHMQYQNQAMHNQQQQQQQQQPQQQQQQSQNAQQNYDSNNYNPVEQQNQVLPQMLQNSGNQQQQQQQQHQLQQSQQEINSLQQQMGLGPGPGGDSLGFPDLTDPILQFGD